MPNLTPTQQKDLEVYKETGELGKSLENLLIEHCLEELNETKVEEINNMQDCFQLYWYFDGPEEKDKCKKFWINGDSYYFPIEKRKLVISLPIEDSWDGYMLDNDYNDYIIDLCSKIKSQDNYYKYSIEGVENYTPEKLKELSGTKIAPDFLKIFIIQTLLSRTPPTPEHPQGQAVIPFLNVETEEWKAYPKTGFEVWRDFWRPS